MVEGGRSSGGGAPIAEPVRGVDGPADAAGDLAELAVGVPEARGGVLPLLLLPVRRVPQLLLVGEETESEA